MKHKSPMHFIFLIFRAVVVLSCISLASYSAYDVIESKAGAILNRNLLEDISSIYNENSTPNTTENIDIIEEEDLTPVNKKPYESEFVGLNDVNNDIVGWLKVEDTGIDFPVVQSLDNDYYLKRDFLKKQNKNGSIFMDYRVNTDPDSKSKNIILYGHNMKNGQMFGELTKYKDIEYFRDNPVIMFKTPYEFSKYKILSVFTIGVTSASKFTFKYHNFINDNSEEGFNEFINQATQRSLYVDIPVDISPSDELLTLSTCDYDFNGARFVVVARKIRDGEDETVDVNLIKENPEPFNPKQ